MTLSAPDARRSGLGGTAAASARLDWREVRWGKRAVVLDVGGYRVEMDSGRRDYLEDGRRLVTRERDEDVKTTCGGGNKEHGWSKRMGICVINLRLISIPFYEQGQSINKIS